MPKKNTGRKINILKDELKISGAGLYAFMPFENVDEKGKAVIKIGESSDLSRRSQDYTTYFPNGVYMLAFLTNIKGKRVLRGEKNKTGRFLREEIEQFIMDYIANHKGKRLYSTDRVRRPNNTLEGQTEWVYSDVELLHEAFLEAGKEYNANAELFYLQGLNPKTGKFEDITNKTYKKPNYTGTIVFNTK